MSFSYIDYDNPQDVSLVNTVCDKLEGSNKNKISEYKLYQKYRGIIVHTSKRYFNPMVSRNIIQRSL